MLHDTQTGSLSTALELAVGTRFQIAMTARVKIKKAKKVVRQLLGYDGMPQSNSHPF